MTTWINSQFPRPDFHRQVQRHYGLHNKLRPNYRVTPRLYSEQNPGIRPLYDEFFQGYGAEITLIGPDFRPNSTYKPSYMLGGRHQPVASVLLESRPTSAVGPLSLVDWRRRMCQWL